MSDSTIGVEFACHMVSVGDKNVKLQIARLAAMRNMKIKENQNF